MPESSMLGTCADVNAEALWTYLHCKEIQTLAPKNLRFAWGWKSEDGKRKCGQECCHCSGREGGGCPHGKNGDHNG